MCSSSGTPSSGVSTMSRPPSLVGLAPVANDSGQTCGKRSIRGGPRFRRQALYISALQRHPVQSAAQNQIPGPHQSRNPPRVALVAVMREAPHPRQRPHPQSAKMVPKRPLTNTDTTKFGDAPALRRSIDPNAASCSTGRVAEDFKLATGTSVSVGPLRAEDSSPIARPM